jgi:hypothetical protein
LNNITAGVREREDANRTREAGHLDEIQGVVANTLNALRGGAVGLIDWLGGGWLHAALGHLYKPDEITLCIFCSCNQFAASDISHCLLRLSASIEH